MILSTGKDNRFRQRATPYRLILLLTVLALAAGACGSMKYFSRDEGPVQANDTTAPLESKEVLRPLDKEMKGDLFICEFETEGADLGTDARDEAADTIKLLQEVKIYLKNIIMLNVERRSPRFFVKRCTRYHRRLKGLALRGRYVRVINHAGRYKSMVGLSTYTVRVNAELMRPRSNEVVARFTVQAGPGKKFGDASWYEVNQKIADRMSEFLFQVLEAP